MDIEEIFPFLEDKVVIVRKRHEKEIKEYGFTVFEIFSSNDIPSDARTVIVDSDVLNSVLEKIKKSNVRFLIVRGGKDIKVEGFSVAKVGKDYIVLYRNPRKMAGEVKVGTW